MESNSVDFVFSWDSMVNFNYRLLDMSIFEINRILKNNGYAFIHHSNYRGAFAAQGLTCSENYEENKMGRACTSYVDMRIIAKHYNMKIVEQKLQDWGNGENFIRHVDCITILQKISESKPHLDEVLFKSGYITKPRILGEKMLDMSSSKEDSVSINILGCCVSRDIFNLKCGINYTVKGYVQRNCPLDIFDEIANSYKISDLDVEDIVEHNFNKRSLCTLFNGTGSKKLLENKGKWIIIDSFYSGCGCFELTFPDRSCKYIQTDWGTVLKKLVTKLDNGIKCNFIDGNENFLLKIDKFTNFIKNNWGNNVILLDLPRTNQYLATNGTVQIKSTSYIESINAADELCKLLLERLDCHYVRMPHPLYGDSYNSYDVQAVHYIKEAYQYLKEAVDIIVNGVDVYKKLDLNYIKYSQIFHEIALGTRLSERNTIQIIKRIIASKDVVNYPKCVQLCNQLILQGSVDALYLLSVVYRDGLGVNKDIDFAIELMEKAYSQYNDYGNALIDLLWNRTDTESCNKIIRIASQLLDCGNAGVFSRFGRMYRDGKSVEKNIDLSIEYFYKAKSKDLSWSIELFDVMWNANRSEYDSQLKNAISELADKGNPDAMVRRGRMYRYGRGEIKDFEKALFWIKKAADMKKNYVSEYNELKTLTVTIK